MYKHPVSCWFRRHLSIRRGESLRCLLLILPVLLLISRLFFPFSWPGIIMSIAVAFCVSRQLAGLIRKRQQKAARDQLIMLLEYLSARLNAGTSLERALIEAPEQLEIVSGRKARLWQLLQQISTRLASGQPLDQSLGLLGRELACPEAALFCQSLILLRQADARLHTFVRSQLELNMAARQTIAESVSEQAQRRTEAWLLCLMPPLMACLMQASLSGGDADTIEWLPARAALLLAFGINCFGLILVLHILSRSGLLAKPDHSISDAKPLRGLDQLAVRFWKHLYNRWLPAAYVVPLNQAMNHLQPTMRHTDQAHPDKEITRFYLRKTRVFLISLVVLAPCLASGIWPALLLPFILLVLQDQQLLRDSRNDDDISRHQFPIWIQNITTLLQSGLSVHRSLQISSDVFLTGDLHTESPLIAIRPVIHQIRQRLDLSWSSEMILREQADLCQITEIRSALQLMARYAADGGLHLLELISMQASVCRQVQRNSLRRQLDRQSLALLLPIALQLMAVMLATAAPAAATLMAGF